MHIPILLAHAGHAGDHGWLAGALQPLLSLDHLLAGLFVAVVLSVALWRFALRAPRKGDAEAPRRS
jgi:hydrogenase/urease accessory protein HupE